MVERTAGLSTFSRAVQSPALPSLRLEEVFNHQDVLIIGRGVIIRLTSINI
jgi:hypothetical protein